MKMCLSCCLEQFHPVHYYGVNVVTISLRKGLGKAILAAQLGRTHTTATLHFRCRKV